MRPNVHSKEGAEAENKTKIAVIIIWHQTTELINISILYTKTSLLFQECLMGKIYFMTWYYFD